MTNAVLPRLSASLIVLRDDPLEVLMVRRRSGGTFSSALVFPGGIVDPEDMAPEWHDCVTDAGSATPHERALRIAALREAYEEVGLLQLSGGQRIPDTSEHRSRPFMEMIRATGERLDISALVHCANWITPAFLPKRFDAHFFLLRVEGEHELRHDGKEIVDFAWVDPATVLREEKNLPAPTRANLMQLVQAGSATAAIEAAQARPRTTVLPVLEEREDGDYLITEAHGGLPRNERKLPDRARII